MKNISVAVVFVCMAFTFAHALAGVDERNWSRVWGDINDTKIGGCAVGGNGRVYMTGAAKSGFHNQSLPGTESAVVSGWDKDGLLLWTRIFGPSGTYAEAHAVTVDGMGRVYVAGQTWGAMDGESVIGNGDMFLKVFDADGSNLWTRIFGSSSVDEAYAVGLDASTNIYIAGYASGNFGGASGHNAKKDLCLVKLTREGSNQWVRVWGSSEDDYARGVALFGTNVYVAGYAGEAVGSNTFAGTSDVVLTKFGSGGTKLWTKMWGSSGLEVARAVVSDGAGGIYVAGYGGAFNGMAAIGGTDPFLMGVASDGSVRWTVNWGSTGDDTCSGLAVGGDGLLYSAGLAAYARSFDGLGGYDGGIFLSCHNTNGVRQWSRRWGGSDSEGWSVAPYSTNVVYVGGWSYAGFDGQPGGVNDHLFVSHWGPYGPPRITFGPDVWSPGTTNATVEWQLNRDADGVVDVSRFEGRWEFSATNAAYTTRHAVVVGGLTPGSTYRYQVRSTAQDGQSVTSAVSYFTTASGGWGGSVESRVMSDDLFAGRIVVSPSGDVDRVEVSVNGSILGTWYGDGAEWNIGDDTPGITLGTNNLMVTGYRSDGNMSGMDMGSWVRGSTGLPTRCEIELPWHDFVFYCDGTSAPATNLQLRVLAARQITTVVDSGHFGPFGSESDRTRLEWGAVSNVRFYVDGTLVHTSTNPLPNPGGADLYHEYYYDITGMSTGVHRFHAAFTPPPNYEYSSDSRDFSIEQRHADLRAWRDVDFNSTTNCLVVDFTILNRGTSTAYITNFSESVIGFQIGRVEPSATWDATNFPYYWDQIRSRVRLYSTAGIELTPGSHTTIRYYAVPVLFEGGGEYQIGGYGVVRGSDAHGADVALSVDSLSVTVGDWLHRVPLLDAVALCKCNSDYLLVTDPVSLNGCYGWRDCGKILSTMAELATWRNGVLGYYYSERWVWTAYRDGDCIAVGDTFDADDDYDQIWVGDASANRIRAFSRYKEVRSDEVQIPYAGDVRRGDALAVGNFININTDGGEHPRDEVLLMLGDEHGTAAGDMKIYQYKPSPGHNTLDSFDISDPDGLYGTGGAVLAGRFWGAYSNDVAAIFSPDGNMRIAEFSRGVARFGDIQATLYRSGDSVAAGNLFGGDMDEIVVCDVAGNRICLYGVDESDIHNPRHYYLVTLFTPSGGIGAGDIVAIGDVMGGGGAELLFGDVSADRLYVYNYNDATASFILNEAVDIDLEDGDCIMVGHFDMSRKGQLIIVNRDGHDGLAAGSARVFRLVHGMTPGSNYGLNTMLDEGGEWAEQMSEDWLSDGFLLLVGEQEIIPSFRSSWRVYTGSWETRTVRYNDAPYASTFGSQDAPELAMGRITGNGVSTLTSSMRTSIALASGRAELKPRSALAVAGDEDGWRFRIARLRGERKIRELGFSTLTSLDNTNPTTTVQRVENRDLVVFYGHGNWNTWDGVDTDILSRELTMGSTHPLVYASSCLTGNYIPGWSFGEVFLYKGACAYIGATEVTYSTINPRFAADFLDRLNDAGNTIGRALKLHKRKWSSADMAHSRSRRRHNRCHCAAYNLYGDPKLSYDWSGVTTSSAGLFSTAETNDFSGPTNLLHVSVPMYQVEHTNGVDRITIPGEGQAIEDGQPIVPLYAVTVSFPSGCCVQAVSMQSRSGETQISGLHPEIAHIEADGIAPYGGSVMPQANGWWPETEYNWSVEESSGGASVLTIVMCPFYHNTNTADSVFYTNYTFAIDYVQSGIDITAVTTDRHVYTNGQEMAVNVYLHSTNMSAQNITLYPTLVCVTDDSETALPVRELRNMSGWAGCRFVWPMNVQQLGEYRLEVAAMGKGEVVYDRAFTRIEVGGAGALLRNASVTPDKFVPGDSVNIGVVVENSGSIELDGVLHFLVQDGAGNTVEQFQHSFTGMVVGASQYFNSTWTNSTLVSRNCRVLYYVVYGGGSSGLQLAADGSEEPLVVNTAVAPGAGGGCVVRWPSVAGFRYSVLGSTNLLNGFVPVASNLTAMPPYNSFTNSAGGTRFYRIRETKDE